MSLKQWYWVLLCFWRARTVISRNVPKSLARQSLNFVISIWLNWYSWQLSVSLQDLKLLHLLKNKMVNKSIKGLRWIQNHYGPLSITLLKSHLIISVFFLCQELHNKDLETLQNSHSEESTATEMKLQTLVRDINTLLLLSLYYDRWLLVNIFKMYFHRSYRAAC